MFAFKCLNMFSPVKLFHYCKTLHDAGASLKMKNKDGATPLDLALQLGAERLAKGFQTLLEIPENKWVRKYINDSHSMQAIHTK